ncbi:filamentous hemagglutinin N-terminal domain-containing protein [Tolypothrix sp. VBCCA 56010]|uniref:filamentous hemagglutinin N-terminal domain-containing protein n=1 Tax=Tolypothrix sp. VBCCA 56010 TaxID=3137731 RepID=UPI003D7C3A35
MNTRLWYGCWLKIGIVLAATSGYLCSQRAIAQIVPDRTLGGESSIVTPNVDIKGVPSDRIDAGAIRGANLFHSFQEFNIREGRGAYFSNPTGVENIFSRVTGTNASNIFGKLGVLGNANLFLLNPNGIIFGPNASLDINGSFSASTGNSFNFGDEKFSATNPTNAPLLSVKVPLGVQFNQNQPSVIANSGNLSVGTGQNLNLIGGTVVSTGQLSAPSGQVAVVAVPGGSVVNLSPSGQFLNVETSSPVASVGSSSLSELLTSVDERSRPGLTVNSNGQVELTGSGLPVVDGDVVARNVTAQTATLTANNNLTLIESQLGTTGDLNLLAGDTVRVRDSVANPFVAQAGGKLLVQGRQGVDIFALNNSSSGLVSGGDMVLRSLNTVGGDAHYWAGGNFRIEQMDGSLGGLFSPYDPIIRASGDVSFQSYTGGSLHILAGGSVTIPGTVTITGADGTNGLVETVLTQVAGYQILGFCIRRFMRSRNDDLLVRVPQVGVALRATPTSTESKMQLLNRFRVS